MYDLPDTVLAALRRLRCGLILSLLLLAAGRLAGACPALAPPWPEVAARAGDGVVEAIEKVGSRFMVGVQWHPEALAGKYPEALDLFREFVIAAQGV